VRAALLLSCCAALVAPNTASAWNPLRAENPNVEQGNELMVQEQYAEALDAYDRAARELPDERAVQLNRGLALLSQGLTEPAKEAFTAAADPSAAPEVRADAYYDLGIAHAREGDVASEQEDFEQASAHFREAADAFKRALRARPGNRNAAWNLEYALKRIREEEQKQDQQEQQQEQQEQDQQEQDQQEQDQQEQEQQEQEQQEQDQQEQDQQEQDQQEQEREQEPEQEQDQQDQQENESPMQPSEVERFLDALEQNEESLPLERARRRSAGQRPPEKDW
jgi:Ca-activated chloride channel family protein